MTINLSTGQPHAPQVSVSCQRHCKFSVDGRCIACLITLSEVVDRGSDEGARGSVICDRFVSSEVVNSGKE